MPVLLPGADGFDLYESDQDSWVDSFGRVLLNGPPLSGKTRSFLTFPARRVVIVAPREQGHTTLRETKETAIFRWQFPTIKDAGKYQTIWKSVQEQTAAIIDGDFGDVKTLCLDGLHKLYYLIMKANGYVAGTDTREFGRYHEVFLNYLDSILTSSIPFIVASVYDGQEPMEEEEVPGQKKKMGVFAALPGRMGKEIMGSFPLVFHTERSLERSNGKLVEVYRWRFRVGEKIQGAGGHLPPEIAEIFPATIAPDWNEVVSLIKKQQHVDINKELTQHGTEASQAAGKGRGKATGKAGTNKGRR